MSARIARLIAAAVGLALALSVLRPASPPATAAQPPLVLPPHRELVDAVARASRADAPAVAPGARLAALVELDLAPLAVAGKGWDQAQRQAHLAELSAAQDALAARVTALGGTVLARFSHASSGLAVAVERDDLAALAAAPGVSAVLRVGDYRADQGEPAPTAATLAELSALLGADEVRRRGNDGSGIEIAVVDSGLDYTHVKLGGSGAPAAYNRAVCGDAALPPGSPGCANGLADPPADLFPNAKVRGGYDYVGDIWPAPDARCGTLVVCELPDANPIDLDGHGTHVADIAAGLPSAPGGADSGVAPGANLWAFKACNGDAGRCSGVALLKAIDAALDLDGSDARGCPPGDSPGCVAYDPADVINLSVSFAYGQPEDALALFVNVASFYGSLVVASAGNHGDVPYIVGSPAAADGPLAVAESRFPAPEQAEQIAPDASRGPRINDSALKPDLAAPGAVRSALAGSGAGDAPFAGASGAAPVAAGVAALVIQELVDFQVLDPAPGLGTGADLRLSLAPLVKAVLMNSGADLRTPAGELAPFTLQGAGRIDALRAFTSRTMAWDASQMVALLAEQEDLAECSISPYTDLLAYLFFGVTPPCAADYPGGDPLFRAWNAQTGSISLGYQAPTATQVFTRQLVVSNYSLRDRSYRLSTDLRFAEDAGRGVSLAVTPAALAIPAKGFALVTATVTIEPAALRDWTLNGGGLGNSGSPSCTIATPELDCPSLTLFEADGAITIDGGPANTVRVPVHLLPRRAADVELSRVLQDQLILANASTFKAGVAEAFALVDDSPSRCESDPEPCIDGVYVPGARPGLGYSPVDIGYVGLRSYAVPGLNGSLALPPAAGGALDDELVEFAVTVRDQPFRAAPNYPVRFDVGVDANADGVADYAVYNRDLVGNLDGRSAVFVRDLNPADGVQPERAYFFAVADFNSQNWVLPVPAAAIELRSDRPFRWWVAASDAYFATESGPRLTDCSPLPAAQCGDTAHTMQTGALRLRPAARTLLVPPDARVALPFSEDPGGPGGSPSQIGLLLLHRDNPPGRESSRALLR